MEWFVLTIAAWIVERLLDTWLERWKTARANRAPLTDVQVLAHHRRRFGAALFLTAWCALMLVLSIVTAPPAPGAWWYVAVVAIAGIGVHAALRLPRYRRRVRDARARMPRG